MAPLRLQRWQQVADCKVRNHSKYNETTAKRDVPWHTAYLQVTDEFSGARDILHYSNLKESNKGKDLGKTSATNRWERSDTGGNGLERRSVVINVTWETHTGSGDNVTKNSKHRDSAVFDLNITQAIEAGTISTIQESERVKESERCLGANLTFERSQ
jgi:hypothetical protein